MQNSEPSFPNHARMPTKPAYFDDYDAEDDFYDGPSLVIAFGVCGLSGFIIGLIATWVF